MCARQSRRVTRRVRAFGHPHRWCASSRSRARRSGSRRTPRPDRRSVQTVTHAARAQPRDEHVHARDSAMVQAVTSLSHTLLVPCPPSRRPLAPSASARRCPRSPAPSHSSQMCCRPPATRHRTRTPPASSAVSAAERAWRPRHALCPCAHVFTRETRLLEGWKSFPRTSVFLRTFSVPNDVSAYLAAYSTLPLPKHDLNLNMPPSAVE